MIYLASPYSDPDPNVMQARYDKVCEACAGLANKGITVYSPIAHWHPIAMKYNLPKTYFFWELHDQEMIKGCYRFVILKLFGWDTSKGIKKEIKYAEENGKLIEKISFNKCR